MPAHTAVATLHTNHGDIVVNLFGDHAPRTVQNFIGLSDGTTSWTNPATGQPGEGALYSDVVFHRIIPNFMIQGGDPLGQGTGGPGYNFNDEIHPELTFEAPYKLAMANAGLRRNAITGAAEGTNGSQFFITTDPTPWLQGKHSIFGEVADDASRAVVDAIAAVPTAAGDRPVSPVVLSSVDIETV
ncbi:peptidyl-prolyl cis-trans isomerase A (cyclophilin A) [Microbacterium endophyticum]|uniref:Peptidyl-prolyl cis-trans isomerase n=2 Tax=Microbacterium TaxID=33882 RepID=A0A7W3PMH6_9MICO|nr:MULTISPECIES: peptidylprolyl isomerase [Microbacterium]MBA8817091.1 peptidyl-prolyl cis-trans isomerase A (cyclophilin A) [Microbacterium halimionae]MBB2976539.1 peptidyl-prolyl cis-trans isomerase A (cyclophilin A) [Microbacterium endophyticum]NII94369.1 peptidyl-prolyl cis-trans isomerase A (cyclophilin A) [Microbacterium halimionae]NIK35985.1 peptidyl-prolyl cis-trans isomerase A (cyclophilin A) [Microbacterium endophyticum]